MGRLAGRPGLTIATQAPADAARPPRPAAGRGRARWGRLAGTGAVALLVSLVFGVTTASVQQSFGPHEARYSVTTDDLVTVDLGPLGSVEIDSPLPLTLGVEVVVEEIPRSVTAVDPARTVQALGQDLASYVQFFTGPQATIADAARALAFDVLRRTLLALLALAAVAVGGRALLGPVRRRELAAAVAPHRRDAARATTIAVGVVALCVSSEQGALRAGPEGRPSAVFDGTPLEGARITGRLAGVVDTYGSFVVDAYRENEAFYAAAQADVAQAWDQRAQAIAAREGTALLREIVEDPESLASAAPGAGTASGPVAGPADPTPVGPDDGPGAETGVGPDAQPDEDGGATDDEPVEPVVMVLVADLHCNVGMARIIGTVAERSGADLILNAGDTTVNGTSVERYCITTFARAVPRGVPTVVADGNHDSLETAQHERESGWTVLDGQVVEAAGVRILGDRDPNQTQIGGGTAQVAGETGREMGERLARAACDDGAVDVLLVHTPWVGDAALGTGCVPVQLSGHQHRRTGPVQVGQGMRYVSSTTAGATTGGATIGPLNGVATLTVLRFDPEDRRMIDLQVVEVAPDGSATVGPREPFGVPQPADDDAAPERGAEDGGIPPGVPGPDQPPGTGDDDGDAGEGDEGGGDAGEGGGGSREGGGEDSGDGSSDDRDPAGPPEG